jgi:hypothetical protein
MLATAPVFAADYAQAPGAGSILVFATKYDGEVFTGSFPGFATKLLRPGQPGRRAHGRGDPAGRCQERQQRP